MIFFTENPVEFDPGELFAIQGMAGLPAIPPGRTVVGQGYNLTASPGAALPPGSVSIQYLADNVLVAGADESDLTIYFSNGSAWSALDTLREPEFNLVSAPSQGPGIYALMASVQIPLSQVGWNPIGYPVAATRPVAEALASIAGKYTLVYGYVVTDTIDPWKLYAVGVDPIVNDLPALSFGNSYWIYATVTTTVYLAPGPAAAAHALVPPSPFYGRVTNAGSFTPAPGQTVTAWVNGTACGQGATREVGGEIMYVVDVLAASPADATCGLAGAPVVFEIGANTSAVEGVWDNTRVSRLDLVFGLQRIYLPTVQR
jgi:hypothetical protein